MGIVALLMVYLKIIIHYFLDMVIKWLYNLTMTDIPLTIRFTEKELHKAITASAKKNRRSLNSEILRAIEFYLQNAPEAQQPTETKKVTEKPKVT
jgi:hypothetical protein